MWSVLKGVVTDGFCVCREREELRQKRQGQEDRTRGYGVYSGLFSDSCLGDERGLER